MPQTLNSLSQQAAALLDLPAGACRWPSLLEVLAESELQRTAVGDVAASRDHARLQVGVQRRRGRRATRQVHLELERQAERGLEQARGQPGRPQQQLPVARADFAAAREALGLLDVEVERFRSLLPVLIAGSSNS